MNGINYPKVVECLGSDGHKYKQLAKSGNDDLRQDAVGIFSIHLFSIFLVTQSILRYNHRNLPPHSLSALNINMSILMSLNLAENFIKHHVKVQSN